MNGACYYVKILRHYASRPARSIAIRKSLVGYEGAVLSNISATSCGFFMAFAWRFGHNPVTAKVYFTNTRSNKKQTKTINAWNECPTLILMQVTWLITRTLVSQEQAAWVQLWCWWQICGLSLWNEDWWRPAFHSSSHLKQNIPVTVIVALTSPS